MSRLPRFPVLLVGLLVGLGLAALSFSGMSEPDAASAQSTPVPPTPSPPEAPGAPAITPYLPGTGPAGATFTYDDATAYVLSTPRMKWSSAHMTIVSVEFLTGRDLNARIQGDTAISDDAQVCLVTLKGPTFVSGPPPRPPSVPKVVQFNTGYVVFDAQTGNLLLESVGP